jgi:ADP-L-glycero-D-manno-heptose 6-epimerase
MKRAWVVTGAAGFIGSALIERLRREDPDAEVISIDALSHFETRKEHPSLRYGIKVERQGAFEPKRFQEITEGFQIAGVFHMGACTDTTELREDYLKLMNYDYSIAVWERACEHRLPLVYASSAATYGEGELGYSDADEMTAKLKPLNPYGESKRKIDEWVLQRRDLGTASPPTWSGFKFFNVYGFGERHKKNMASVVYHAWDQIQAHGKVKLFQSHREGIRDGEQKRDFIWVEDLVDVLLFAMRKPIRSGIYNLGTGEANTFRALADAVFQALNLEPKIEFIPTPVHLRERYQYYTQADMRKLRAAGYEKRFHSLDEGVKSVVERLRHAYPKKIS